MAKKHPDPWKRGDFYYFTVAENGKRRNLSTGCTLKEDARAFVRQYVDARAAGSAESFRIYSAPYFTWESCPHVARRLDEGKQIGQTHCKQSRALLDKWVYTDPVFPDLPLRTITRGHVLDLRRRLRERIPAGMNTVNKTIMAVKTVLAEASFRGDIPADPGSKVGGIKYEARERGVFEAAEVARILAARPGDMGKSPLADCAITLLFATGCRVGELRALRWGAVNLDTGRTAIREAFQDSRRLGPPKWGKVREIVLARLALERLRAWKAKSLHTAPEDFVLSAIDGVAVGITWIKDYFERTLQAAEKDKELDFTRGDRWLTPHAARHSLNTALLAAGVNPLLVESFLGWSPEARILGRVQRGYTHLALLRLEDVAAMVDKLYGGRKIISRKRADSA